MTTIDAKLTRFTVYDWAHFNPDDFDSETEPDDCAVHEIVAKTPDEAIEVVAAIRDHGPDDEMFVDWVFESPDIPIDSFHEIYNYGVRGDVIVIRHPP